VLASLTQVKQTHIGDLAAEHEMNIADLLASLTQMTQTHIGDLVTAAEIDSPDELASLTQMTQTDIIDLVTTIEVDVAHLQACRTQMTKTFVHEELAAPGEIDKSDGLLLVLALLTEMTQCLFIHFTVSSKLQPHDRRPFFRFKRELLIAYIPREE